MYSVPAPLLKQKCFNNLLQKHREENMRIKEVIKSVAIMFQQNSERQQGNEILFPTAHKALGKFVKEDFGDFITGEGLKANKVALSDPQKGRQVYAYYPVEILKGVNTGIIKTVALEITATASEEGSFIINLKLQQ